MVEKQREENAPEGSTGGDGVASGPTEKPRVGASPDRANIGLLVVNTELTVVDLGGSVEGLSELAPDPVGTALESIHPGIDDETVASVRDALRTDAVVEFETTLAGDGHVEIRVVPTADGAVLHLQNVSDRVSLRRELKRSRRILETLDDGVYTLDEAFVITSVNEAVTRMTGYDREELVGSHASMLAGDDTLAMADRILEQLRSDGSDVGLIESSIRTADGESLPIETRFSTVEFADGSRQRVGILRDATDRRRHERTLRELNRSARALLDAEDARAVCETVVTVAASVWPATSVAAYLFDRSNSVLEPIATSGTNPDTCGPGTVEWEAFATGDSQPSPEEDSDSRFSTEVEATDDTPSFRQLAVTPETASQTSQDGFSERYEQPTGRVIERADDGAPESGGTLFATLDKHGLLTVEFPPEGPSENLVESVELLAANVVAALGRVEREAELSRRRETLAERNRRLKRLHGFNDLLRQINGALVEADTLEDIATAVCDHLGEADRVAFAWLGEGYRNGGGIDPVAQAGNSDGYLDDLAALTADGDGASDSSSAAADASDTAAEPTGRALALGEPVVVPDVSAGLRDSRWRERALVRGYQSVASVPLVYNDLEYGVLSVYADQPNAFDGPLGELLEELGTTVANAINGVETKRSLRSESLVELDLRIDEPSELLVRLSRALEEPVRIEGTVPQGDDRSVVYLVSEADPEPLTASIRSVEEVRSVGDETDPRAEITVSDSTVVDRLADYGASVEELLVDPDGIDATVVLPRSADVRSLVESLEERYRAVELRARRERGPSTDGRADVSGILEERLTDRQREALRTAYLSGYFEWPRASTGEEVAAALGITQPTFNRHLRTTERKLFSLLFEEL